jgi:hypothetical protein
MKCPSKIYNKKDSIESSIRYVASAEKGISPKTTRMITKKLMSNSNPFANSRTRDGFDKRDLIRILTELKFPFTKP